MPTLPKAPNGFMWFMLLENKKCLLHWYFDDGENNAPACGRTRTEKDGK